MKKPLLLITGFILFAAAAFSQASFITGPLEVSINQYGRIRLFDDAGIRHLQRASILVGKSSSEVFDYNNDAEQLDSTVLVETPQVSDFEIYGSTNNAYSGAPPDVIVKYNAYGWNEKNFVIVKFNVKNNEASAMNALIGLDIIPELNEEYGYDTVTYNTDEGVIRFHRGNQMNMGIKLLSTNLSSLYSFEWYDGYTVDQDYWTWMNEGSLQPQYVSNTVDGPVTITSQAGVDLAQNVSTDVYYAFALGATEEAMLANIDEAVSKYNSVFSSVAEALPSNGLVLERNYPNPVSESTTIKYTLPSSGFVSLKVYDALGNLTTTLVSEKQPTGQHTVDFNVRNLPEGMYYCSLTFENQVKSNKIFVVK